MERLEHPLPDAAAWIRFFAERADKVPILRHTKRRLEELRPAAETLNAHVLSQVVLQDPLLTLRLMVTLQKRRPPDLRTRELTTIDRILLMLGIRAFYAECDRMTLVEEELADQPRELAMLLRLIARLRRAARFAREWALLRRDIEVSEVVVAALLHDITEVLMWLYAPRLMSLLIRLRRTYPAIPLEQLQRKVFNATEVEIRNGLIDALELPEILKKLLDDHLLENPRTRTVWLATRLARHLAHGWNDPRIPADLDAIQELVHVNREILLKQLGAPEEAMARLLGPAGETTPPTQTSGEAAAAVSADASKPSGPDAPSGGE